MTSSAVLDIAARKRSPATLPGYHCGRPPDNKGRRYPADPPRVEEIVAVMRQAGPGRHGDRVRGLIVVLWRAGLRIGEALDLAEADLDAGRGSLLVRSSKGGKHREAGMDDWGWQQLRPWLSHRTALPPGPLFCVIDGPHPRPALGRQRSPRPTAPARSPNRYPPPLCPPPTPPRARHRDGPGRGGPQHHPTPTRAHRPGRHLHLPARHRQHPNHQRHPLPPTTDDARQRRTTALTRPSEIAQRRSLDPWGATGSPSD
jgi:hypothetical protein